MYASCDGKKVKFENESPVDPVREKEINELINEHGFVDASITMFNIAIVINMATIIIEVVIIVCLVFPFIIFSLSFLILCNVF